MNGLRPTLTAISPFAAWQTSGRKRINCLRPLNIMGTVLRSRRSNMLDLCGVAGTILTRQGIYIFIPENRGLLRNLSYRQRGHLGW